MMRRTPMKRTGFARNTSGPRHIAEILQGIEAPADADAAKFEAMRRHIQQGIVGAFGIPARLLQSGSIVTTPKTEYVRDEGYRRFVASLPCFVCGIAGRSQAAHSNSPADGKGGSIKASDTALFPLCADQPGEIGCHTRHDQAKDGLTREERRAREADFIARMVEISREAAQ